MRNLIKLRTLLFLVAIVIIIVIVSIKTTSFKESLSSTTCSGIVDKIERRERGIYYFLIDDTWCYFGVVGGEVAVHAAVGDSLVKNFGDNKILIYKRDFKDGYNEPRIVTF